MRMLRPRCRQEVVGVDFSPGMLREAARELASKLEKIEHLNLSPDLLGPALTDLFKAGARRLDGGGDGG